MNTLKHPNLADPRGLPVRTPDGHWTTARAPDKALGLTQREALDNATTLLHHGRLGPHKLRTPRSQ